MKPLCMSYDLCATERSVVNPLGMRPCDLNEFASNLATWSAGGATGLDSSSEVFLRFEDCLAFGCPLRFPDFVVVAAFESQAALFNFVFEVDFLSPFATGAVGCGSGEENSG